MAGIPRIHLFEIEDQPWCPRLLRDLVTDHLRFLQVRFGLYGPVASLLKEALENAQTDQVIDLCSGGGGPVPALVAELKRRNTPARFTLTDLFPNQRAFHSVADASCGSVRFEAEPIDARAVPRRLLGVRTFFNCFHHFRPGDARAIIMDAVNCNQPIALFELSDRKILSIACKVLLLPVVVLLTTPLVRPAGWRRLFWTYLVPVVPLICWWDGIVSQLRAYTVEELISLAKPHCPGNYDWRVGRLPSVLALGAITFLVGTPSTSRRNGVDLPLAQSTRKSEV